jgi:hypothetical protein
MAGRGETISIVGVKEFQAALRTIDRDLPKQIRVIMNDAATLVIDWAVPRVPRNTGRAVKSIKARSSQREQRVAIGGNRAPYMPWLDFGGKVGPGGSVLRPFIKKGRYLYPGLEARSDEITEAMSKGFAELATAAGLEMD